MESKKHFFDMMRDVETLSSIDYPKMLSLDVFYLFLTNRYFHMNLLLVLFQITNLLR